MDNTLINNSEAVGLVQDNSQWHPGWITLSSVPPNGVAGPDLQTVVQVPAAPTTDQDLQIEDEEVEADEEMTDINEIDDSSDGDSPDGVGEVDIMAFEAAVLSEPNSLAAEAASSNPLPPTLNPAEVEPLLSDELSSSSEDDDSEITDLEEMPLADETEQQAVEGKLLTAIQIW